MDALTVDFKTPEVFDLARQMEAGGGEFYRHAALKFDDPGLKALILKLAEMEDGHLAIFGTLKDCTLRKAPVVAGERGAPSPITSSPGCAAMSSPPTRSPWTGWPG